MISKEIMENIDRDVKRLRIGINDLSRFIHTHGARDDKSEARE